MVEHSAVNRTVSGSTPLFPAIVCKRVRHTLVSSPCSTQGESGSRRFIMIRLDDPRIDYLEEPKCPDCGHYIRDCECQIEDEYDNDEELDEDGNG